MKQEIDQDQDQELNSLDDTGRDINPYRELIVNNTEKTDTVLSQMEQWWILSNVVNYIEYDRHPKNFITSILKLWMRKNIKEGLIQRKRSKC